MTNCKEFNSSTISSLIEMFKVCPQDSYTNTSSEDMIDLMKTAIKNGYIFHPNCNVGYIKAFLESRDIQYNSTFYKTWSDVTNKNRLELFTDQVLHYLSTYGQNFEGEAYIPNVESNEPEWETYTVISSICYDVLYYKCLEMLQSGIALKSETVNVLTDYIITFAKWTKITVDVDSIKNREALVIICDELGVLPKDGQKLFSHIIYKATGQTMIIKNRDMRLRIKHSVEGWTRNNATEIIKHLNNEQMIALASVFNRYKELFLAFKHNDKLAPVINKISRLSKKHHRPMTRGFWETLLTKETYNPIEIAEKAKTATNFKLIQVMQSIRERFLLASGMGDNLYIIRNGKIFIKENNYNEINPKYSSWEEIYNILKDQLINNLSTKACKVKFSNKFELACPTSEKNFVGDIPMGSYANIENEGVFGIYWRNEWGTRDFDISYIDIANNKIGWNSNYYSNNQEVIYSGDITDALYGANEIIKFKNGCPNGIIYVSRYWGQPNSKFKLFFGKDDFTSNYKNKLSGSYYMVDPNKVIIETMVTQNDADEMMVGAIIDNKVHFITLSCGYGKVAQAVRTLNDDRKINTESITNMLKRKAMAMISLKEILLAAGFTEVNANETPEIDFSNLDRSTLIELFS